MTLLLAQPSTGTLYVDGTNGNDAIPGISGYKTVAAALATTIAGNIVVVFPGTYAENVTIPDNVTLHGKGNPILGTGAGPAVQILSPASGEIGYITGSMTLKATNAITVIAGAILHLDPDVTLNGTKIGPWRVDRTIHLASGNAIATYCPADSSLCAVLSNDLLWDEAAPGAGLFHMELVNAVAYWIAADTGITGENIGSVAATGNKKFDFQQPAWATKAVVRGFSTLLVTGATNDGTDYWTLELSHKAAIIATASTAAMTTSRYIYTRTISHVATSTVVLFMDGDEEAGTANLTQLIYTKINAPTNLNIQTFGVQLAFIRE